MRVAEDLEFDVTRPGEVLLDIHFAVSEGREGFRPRELERAREIVLIAGDPHALSATAGGPLDDHREADATRERDRVLGFLDRAWRSRNDRPADLDHALS